MNTTWLYKRANITGIYLQICPTQLWWVHWSYMLSARWDSNGDD